MPRSFLLAAGVDPDKDLRRVAFSGAHDATIAAVASGKVQAGALNISVWEKFVADGKVDTGKVRVFYTTPPYFDYNWTVHADMPAAQKEKITAALLALSRDTPEGKEILELQRATRFVPTKAENYKGIEAAARNAGLL
jgi:phosphonate transport system substrate-binding protein